MNTKQTAIKLSKKSLVWQSNSTVLPNPNKIGFLESRFSAEYKLPISTVSILSIILDGKPVYDGTVFEIVPRTYMLGGGGRFIHKRRMLDKDCVLQCLTLRDICVKNKIEIVILEEV